MDEHKNSYENIPEKLKELGLFCVYRKEKQKSKLKKIPYQPILGNKASTSNRDQFSSYEDALEDYEWIPNNYDGIGLLLTNDLCLIDIDNCIYKNKLSPLAKRIFNLINSYTEISPSGKGLHILFLCSDLNNISEEQYYKKNSNNHVETYFSNSNRYVTLTGNIYDEDHVEISDRTNEYKVFLEKFMKRPRIEKNIKEVSKRHLKSVQEIDDLQLIEKIKNSKNGDKFKEVFLYGNTEEFPSESEADMFLAGLLTFFCAKDEMRIKKLMKQSALYRNKWDKNPQYLDRTIKRAIENCINVYDPNWKNKKN